ncbi:unnamed protein product [Closterium sp. NIES-64]|nr:unnamed protein product [Closterium sp. NIES-64]
MGRHGRGGWEGGMGKVERGRRKHVQQHRAGAGCGEEEMDLCRRWNDDSGRREGRGWSNLFLPPHPTSASHLPALLSVPFAWDLPLEATVAFRAPEGRSVGARLLRGKLLDYHKEGGSARIFSGCWSALLGWVPQQTSTPHPTSASHLPCPPLCALCTGTTTRGSGCGGIDPLPAAAQAEALCWHRVWRGGDGLLPLAPVCAPQDLPSALGEEDLTHCLELRDLKGRSAMHGGEGGSDVAGGGNEERADRIKQRADAAAAFRYGLKHRGEGGSDVAGGGNEERADLIKQRADAAAAFRYGLKVVAMEQCLSGSAPFSGLLRQGW